VPPYTIDRHQPAVHESSKVKSHGHIPRVARYLTDEQSHSTRCAVHQPPLGTRPNSLDYGLQVCSITASKRISKHTRLWLPNSIEHGRQAYLQPRSIAAMKLARSQPTSVSPNSIDYGLQTPSITASKFPH
jgi:hypothetical protein